MLFCKYELQIGERVFLKLVSEEGPGEAEFQAEIMWRSSINEKREYLYRMKLDRDLSVAA